jgi:hypothetical protein
VGLDGSVLWEQAIPVPAGSYNGLTPPLTPLYATADGGAIVRSGPAIGSSQPGTLYTVDADGNIRSQTPDTGAVLSWTGQWYDPPGGGGQVFDVTGEITVSYANSSAATNGGAPAPKGAFVHSVQKLYRSKIAEVARDYIGATDWVPYWVLSYVGPRSPSVAADDFYTCNIFVGDALQMAGTVVLNQLKGVSYIPTPYTLSSAPNRLPLPEFEDPLSAPEMWHAGLLGSGWVYIGTTEWADPAYYQSAPKARPGQQQPVAGQVGGGAACWLPVTGGADAALAGDVTAEDTERGGHHLRHVGIVAEPGLTISASSRNVTYTQTIVANDWGFRSSDPQNQGLKVDSQVKRFQCY